MIGILFNLTSTIVFLFGGIRVSQRQGYDIVSDKFLNELGSATMGYVLWMVINSAVVYNWNVENTSSFDIFRLGMLLLVFDATYFAFHIFSHATVPNHNYHHNTKYCIPHNAFTNSTIDTAVLKILPPLIASDVVEANLIELYAASLIINIMDLYRHGAKRMWYEGIFMGARDHCIHHMTGRHNYGFFLPWWDMFFGTRMETNVDLESKILKRYGK